MATRPQVPGWNNINLNKPDEYSSEFTVDGNRYANVTNVATGQRQLYLVSGIGGTPLTQRTLLTSTTSNGVVTKGEGYNDFVRVYGAGKLNNAEINNKRQSNAIIQRTSTPQEKENLSQSSQYRSNISNVGSASTAGAATTSVGAATSVSDLLGSVQGRSDIRTSYRTDLSYPIKRHPEQDYIKFTMLEYAPKKVNEDVLGTVASNPDDLQVFSSQRERSGQSITGIGVVTLPISSPISDSNTVSWGDDQMAAFQAVAAATALNLITPDGSNTEQPNETQTSSQNQGSPGQSATVNSVGKYVGYTLAQKAAGGDGGGGFFTRATGAITNPNLELLFKAPTLRTFTFTFPLSARSKKESDNIRDIIRFFKQGMSVKRAKSSLFLKSPHTFNVQYILAKDKKTDNHPYINLIKECALTSCSVNYTPAGNYATFNDGAMTQYEITLVFNELEPIYDDDYTKIDGNAANKDTMVGY